MTLLRLTQLVKGSRIFSDISLLSKVIRLNKKQLVFKYTSMTEG